MARPKRRIKGDRSFRKLLRRMPDTMRDEMVKALDDAGDMLLSEARSKVPVGTGKLQAGLSKKLLKGTLKLRVGLIGKARNRKLFYGRIVEFGRKAQTVNVTRRMKAGGRPYLMKVRAKAGRPFLYGNKDLRQRIRGHLNDYWNRVLTKAAQGVTDD
jgi:hypothetical protein